MPFEESLQIQLLSGASLRHTSRNRCMSHILGNYRCTDLRLDGRCLNQGVLGSTGTTICCIIITCVWFCEGFQRESQQLYKRSFGEGQKERREGRGDKKVWLFMTCHDKFWRFYHMSRHSDNFATCLSLWSWPISTFFRRVDLTYVHQFRPISPGAPDLLSPVLTPFIAQEGPMDGTPKLLNPPIRMSEMGVEFEGSARH